MIDAAHPRRFLESRLALAGMVLLGIAFGIGVMIATDVEPKATAPPEPIEVIVYP